MNHGTLLTERLLQAVDNGEKGLAEFPLAFLPELDKE